MKNAEEVKMTKDVRLQALSFDFNALPALTYHTKEGSTSDHHRAASNQKDDGCSYMIQANERPPE